MPTPTHYQQLITSKLAASGIASKLIKKLHIKLARPSEMQKLKLPEGWAMSIPYFEPNGRVNGFCRYRYLEDLRSEQDKLEGRKELRYVQPPKSINELYLPPLLNWREIALNSSIDIIITEGELKAACAAAHGLACIGLGGVWSFRSGANNLSALPSFKWISWAGRNVILLFDSDAANNPDIAAAEHQLALLLTDLGAKPSIARLPELPDLRKTGLDDFIVAKGLDELQPVLNNAVDFAATAMLYELNNKVVYIRDPGLVVRLDTNQRMTPRAFCEHAFANMTYTEEVMMKNTVRLSVKHAAKEWLKWPHRSELQRVSFAPGKERVFDDCLNVWPGWAVTPKKGDVRPWLELLDYLFGTDKGARIWFEQWAAYPLRYPSTKLFTAAVLWGVPQGTGKSLVGVTLGKIYGRNYELIREEDLTANYNEWAENKQFVMVDDVNGRSNRKNADLLKSMITREKIRLNPKYIPSYSVEDCINYMYTSNQPDAFYLEDKDRRFFVHEVDREPMPPEFYKRYDAWLKQEESIAALFYHLLKVDTKHFNPAAPAMVTASKLAMIEDAKSDCQQWLMRLKRDPDLILRKNNEPIPFDLWRSEDLLKIYDPMGKTTLTANGLAREMKKAGVQRGAFGRQCLTRRHGKVRLWVVRNEVSYVHDNETDLGKLYDKERDAVEEATDFVEQKKKKF